MQRPVMTGGVPPLGQACSLQPLIPTINSHSFIIPRGGGGGLRGGGGGSGPFSRLPAPPRAWLLRREAQTGRHGGVVGWGVHRECLPCACPVGIQCNVLAIYPNASTPSK